MPCFPTPVMLLPSPSPPHLTLPCASFLSRAFTRTPSHCVLHHYLACTLTSFTLLPYFPLHSALLSFSSPPLTFTPPVSEYFNPTAHFFSYTIPQHLTSIIISLVPSSFLRLTSPSLSSFVVAPTFRLALTINSILRQGRLLTTLE